MCSIVMGPFSFSLILSQSAIFYEISTFLDGSLGIIEPLIPSFNFCHNVVCCHKCVDALLMK